MTQCRTGIDRLVLLAIIASFPVGCGSAVSWFTSERASWQYVEDAWGGLKVPESRVWEGQLWLVLRLNVHPTTRMDSGICMRSAVARVSGEQIFVRLNKSVCHDRQPQPAEVSMSLPRAGGYAVVYDDEAAGFPEVGRVTVP
jgi:hypothetical protein